MGFHSCSSWALEHRLSSWGTWAQLLCSMWDLPRPGIEPMSPALASRVFTTDPLRRPPAILLKNIFLNYFIPTSLLSSVQYYIVHELRQGLCGDQEIRFWGDIKRIEEC